MKFSPKERELAHWKGLKERADQILGWQTPQGSARADRRARLFREMAKMQSRSVVLEVGCGTGEFAYRIAPHVGELWATDLSPDLLSQCATKIQQHCPSSSVVFQIQDITELQLPADKFDAVYGCSVLHHVNPRLALREIHRVLKKEGRCAFSEPNMLNPQIALQKNVPYLKRRVGDTPDETAFFSWELRRLLRETGFVEFSVVHFDFLHPLVPVRWISVVENIGIILERLPVVRAFSGSLMFVAKKT